MAVCRLVAPVLIEQLLALSVGFTDKWLAGNLLAGERHLAAVGLVAYCIAFMPALFAMPAVAATALVARSVGAGDLSAARRAAVHCLVLGAVIVAAVMLVAATSGVAILRILGLPTESTLLAGRYLGIVAPVLPAMMLIHVGVAVLRGAGAMLAGLLSMSIVNVVNAGMSFALATGFGGLPRLGWDGLAWGTVMGYLAGAACVAWQLGRACRGLQPAPHDWRIDRQWGRRVLAVGLPAGIDAAANAFCHLAFLSVVNRLGDVAAAAHGVAITIESLAYLPGSAFQVAAATLAGQFLGAGDERRARRSVGLAATACVALMTTAGLAFFVWAEPLVAWFVGGADRQPAVASLATRLVAIVALVQPALAVLMVLSGGLRGAGATAAPMLVNFAGLAVVRLPLAVFLAWPPFEIAGSLMTLPALGLGAAGAWYAMATDLTVRGLAMLILFSRGAWTRTRV
jgi:putative MATE family efflux protein